MEECCYLLVYLLFCFIDVEMSTVDVGLFELNRCYSLEMVLIGFLNFYWIDLKFYVENIINMKFKIYKNNNIGYFEIK